MSQVVPLLYHPRFNMTYSISSEGVANGGSKQFLRAKAILATSFMRGIFDFTGDNDLTILGEEDTLAKLKIDREHLPAGVFQPRLITSEDLAHVGYLVLPDHEEAGWKNYPGWAAFFTQNNPSTTAMYVYKILQPTMHWLIHKNPQIYRNICNSRFNK